MLHSAQVEFESWRHPVRKYAGVEGMGAKDAAYSTAISVEHCKLKTVDFTGGAADIYTCFGKVMRPLDKRFRRAIQ